MEFSPTSTNAAASRRRSGGTLVEYVMAVGIASIIFLAVTALSMYSGRSFAGMMNYVDLESASRQTMDRMSKEIRQTLSVTNCSTNALSFIDYDGQVLSYTYSPLLKILTRTKGGNSEVLLRGCDDVEFLIYQRNTTNGTFDMVPTTDVALCKAVELKWTCARSINSAQINSENVQAIKVVVRNKP